MSRFRCRCHRRRSCQMVVSQLRAERDSRQRPVRWARAQVEMALGPSYRVQTRPDFLVQTVQEPMVTGPEQTLLVNLAQRARAPKVQGRYCQVLMAPAQSSPARTRVSQVQKAQGQRVLVQMEPEQSCQV